MDPDFPLSPSLTVTAIHGGEGFTTIPDLCRVSVDIRLTPRFRAEDAHRLLSERASVIDRDQPGTIDARLEEHATLPAYRLDPDDPLGGALLRAAREHADASIKARVCGPSNIGNLCAAHDVPATCGFGVGYEGIHAPNERADIGDAPIVYAAYRQAVSDLLSCACCHAIDTRRDSC